MRALRIGTRASRLALAQTREICERLRARAPGVRLEVVELGTAGDRLADARLGPGLGQSFFTKEIEEALLAELIDLAVHSCKDLATAMHPGLSLVAVPPRQDPRDALVSGGPAFDDLPTGARVGTSSPRRRAFLGHLRPDIELVDQRGNVPTRVRAVDEGRYDAAVLAVAGLARLGLMERVSEAFDPSVVLPAAGQGALALQVRSSDDAARELALLADHLPSRTEIIAERACLARMAAGCHAPVGAMARHDDGDVTLTAAVVARGRVHRVTASRPSADAAALGASVGGALLDALGLKSLRGVGLERTVARGRRVHSGESRDG